jgi:hypothetical protein
MAADAAKTRLTTDGFRDGRNAAALTAAGLMVACLRSGTAKAIFQDRGKRGRAWARGMSVWPVAEDRVQLVRADLVVVVEAVPAKAAPAGRSGSGCSGQPCDGAGGVQDAFGHAGADDVDAVEGPPRPLSSRCRDGS